MNTLLVFWKGALDTRGAIDDIDAILYKEEPQEEMKHLELLTGCQDVQTVHS